MLFAKIFVVYYLYPHTKPQTKEPPTQYAISLVMTSLMLISVLNNHCATKVTLLLVCKLNELNLLSEVRSVVPRCYLLLEYLSLWLLSAWGSQLHPLLLTEEVSLFPVPLGSPMASPPHWNLLCSGQAVDTVLLLTRYILWTNSFSDALRRCYFFCRMLLRRLLLNVFPISRCWPRLNASVTMWLNCW